MPRYLELFADQEDNFLSRDRERKDWQFSAQVAKRQVNKIFNTSDYAAELVRNPARKKKLQKSASDSPETAMRRWYLQKYFIAQPDEDGRGAARIQTPKHLPAFERAGLVPTLPDPARLPLFSATLSLRFRLLTPLLTRDDDPFHLFDNPVRRDHVFGLPYLAAASVKGLAADAYQRAFRTEGEFSEPAKNTQEQQTQIAAFRRREGHALRLFGLADDGADTSNKSQAGRLHFCPVWFDAVQYLILNPADPATGQGTVPIQFEAIAPRRTDGAPVEVDVQVFYCNPAGAQDSDAATVRADLARWLAAVAAWWPTLGLGAKRLAGYGAIEPVAATCAAHGWAEWSAPLTKTGPESWMTVAQHIAKGA